MFAKSNLRSYQLKAISYILENKRCGLNLDMGLGKTISSLTAFNTIRNVHVKKLLVIAPLNVAKNVWHNELLKWEHTKHLTYSVCTGNERERLSAFKKNVDVFIVNQENVKWMFDNGFNKYGMIVVDESQGFKNHASQRFKSLKKFKSKYMILLSGTPMPNGYMDMWSQQYLIDRGALLGKNITLYRDRYFIYNSRSFTYKAFDPESIAKLLRTNWLSMKSKDYLELPDKVFDKISVSIDNYKLYKSFEKDYLIKINDKSISAVNSAVLTNKLIQYCNGALYNEDGSFVEIHSNKLDALEEIILAHSSENIIVAFNFKCDEIRIKERFKRAITLNSKNVGTVEKDWNDGKIKLLLCQCSTAKGLNLQKGGRVIVWFGLTWNMESYNQFNARLHRQGQTKPVIIYQLVASKCKDEKVITALNAKDVTQERLMEILKR